MNRRVVVTGMGAVTPLGNCISSYWEGLVSGRSGLGHISLFDTDGFSVKIAAEVKNFQIQDESMARDARKMDRFTQFAVETANQAMAQSGLNDSNVDKNQVGVIIASGIGGIQTFEDQFIRLQKSPRRVSPFFIPMMISDIAAGWVSIQHGLRGPNYGVVSACASGTHAIGDAFRMIKYGDADAFVTGGSDASITKISVAGFSNMKALSTRNDDPQAASRPFEKNRDGFVMGEGAAMLVLEELEHAKKRGAEILGELVGYGATADAHHLTAPAPEAEGAQRAMKRAMEDAGIRHNQVDYVNAHGTSTPHNDRNESKAISIVFGEHAKNKLAISSTKSMTGHLLGAAGAIESVASIQCLQNDIIPPTINYQTPDPDCDLNYTPNKAVEKDVTYAMSNTFGFGGHNGVLLFKKWEG